MFHFLLHITGADNTSGLWYGFWSGFGSDLMEFTVLGVIWKKLNCHVDNCHRIGIHKVEGTPYITCKKHHPTIHVRNITAQHVITEHSLHLSTQEHQNKLLKEVHEHLLSDPEEET